MSVQELEEAVTQLSSPELAQFLARLEEYKADLWDKQIAEDVDAGRFDALRERVRQQRQAGECRPLETR